MAGDKEKKGKKPHKNKPTSKKYKHFKNNKMGKHCPRCGPGVYLATHNNRQHCGKCAYTEFANIK